MTKKIRPMVLATFAVAATPLIAFTPTAAPQVALLATTALIMGGAGHSLGAPADSPDFVTAYLQNRVTNYVIPSLGPGAPPVNAVAVITPEARILGSGFDPDFTVRGIFDGPYDVAVATGQQNLDTCINAPSDCVYNQTVPGAPPMAGDSFIVYGYSQSSTIATLEKIALANEYPDGGGPDVSFVLTANGNRPNGGILTRGPAGLTIPIIGLPFGTPTPTDTQYQTIDISRQYDGWSDEPTNPLNGLAEANALAGQFYLHVNYDKVNLGEGVEQDHVGDTTYYLIPTDILPLLMPLESIPVVGHTLADTLDPPLRVLVEAGYDRTISPGTYTTFNPLYFPNPVALAGNFAQAIPTGLDNGVQDTTGDRPFGTDRPEPYGVGGPPVTLDPQTNTQLASSPVAAASVEDAPAPGPTQFMRPILSAAHNSTILVHAPGQVRRSPLASPSGGPVKSSIAAVGSALKQVTQTVQAAAQNVIKPKPATDTQ